MAILLNDNIQIETGKHVDNKYGPYNDLASALTSIPSFKRARGLTIGVIEGGLLKEYWFKEGINNSDLVEKITSTQSEGGGIDTGLRSLTANWQSTYATVSSLSANWGSGGSSTPVVTVADPLKFNFIGNGITTNFTISGTNESTNASYIEVFVANVRQEPTFSYTLSSNIVKFTEAPPNGSSIIIITPNTKLYNITTNQYSIPYFGGSGAGIISKTYAELKALKDANQLVAGQYYKITDFQLKWWNQSKNDVRVLTSFEIEPLIIFAIGNNKFSQNAYSDLYPKDTIYYGFDDAPFATPGSYYSTIPNAHGWISRRISDGYSSVDAPYDWRHITWNCCRLDLSLLSEWSSSTSYSRRDVIKYNNKLFISLDNGNLNNVPDGARVDGNGAPTDTTNFYWWIAVTPFVEGLTYFPTDETNETAFKLILPSKVNFKLPYDENSNPPVAKYSPSYGLPIQNSFSINSYTLPQSDYITIPWSQDRTQKPTFARNPTAVDSQNYFTGPVKMGTDCYGNVFYGRASFVEFDANSSFNIFRGEIYFLETGSYFSFNRIGYSCWNNKFGNSCYYNSLGNSSTRNTLGEDCNYNLFQSQTNSNNIIGTFRNNILGIGFENNSIDFLFLSNFCGFQFVSNKVGIGVIGNVFKTGSILNSMESVSNNIVRVAGCKVSGFNNNIGDLYNSEVNGANKCVFPTIAPFSGNICNNMLCCEFSWYVLNNKLDNVSYLTSTDTFTFNNISFMTRGIFGYWFRMNTIEPNVYNNINSDIVFTNATFTANDAFNKRIFKNSAGVPRLSYYNASDIQAVVSPTA